jgi:hypothetical protein
MTSRRELYAHGEPLGDNVTRKKLGGGYVCGGGGDSSSSSTQNTTTNQYDQRSITDARQEVTNTTTTNNITTLDAGAIEAGKSVALSSIANNSTNTANLLAVADKLFSQTTKTLEANTQLAGTLASGARQAYSDATSQAAGNKNLVYAGLAVVGIAAFSFFGKK